MSKRAGYRCGLWEVAVRAIGLAAALLFCAFSLLLPASARTKAPSYRWTQVPVAHLAPSVLFKQLGLTHITRIGSARRSLEDPGFPKGLTDVVPYDTQRVMLLRGTESGIAAYQQVIAAADFAAQGWRLTVELLRVDGNGEKAVATISGKDAATGTPLTVSLGDGPDQRTYRLALAARTESAIQLSCQPGLPLPAGAAPVLPAAPAAGTVGVPAPPSSASATATPLEQRSPGAAPSTTVTSTSPPSTSADPQTAPASGTVPPNSPNSAASGASIGPGAAGAPAVGVMTPALVFAPVMSKTVKPGEAATFADTAASRQAALRKLGAATAAETIDYRVRITCQPATAVQAASAGPRRLGPE